MAVPYSPTANTLGLWHLNGDSTDSSGHGYNGTDTSVTYGAGVFGQCAGLLTAGTSIINGINAAAMAFGTGDFTLISWVKRTATGGVGIMGNLFGGAQGVGFYFDAGNTLSLACVSSSTWDVITSAGTFTDYANFHMYCATRIGTSLVAYVDAVSVATGSSARDVSSTKTCSIGKEYYNNAITVAAYFDETITENVGWSAAKVLAYFEAKTSGVSAVYLSDYGVM